MTVINYKGLQTGEKVRKVGTAFPTALSPFIRKAFMLQIT